MPRSPLPHPATDPAETPARRRMKRLQGVVEVVVLVALVVWFPRFLGAAFLLLTGYKLGVWNERKSPGDNLPGEWTRTDKAAFVALVIIAVLYASAHYLVDLGAARGAP